MNSKTPAEILVCDDNHMAQVLIGEILRKMGLRIVFASDGLEAVNAVKARNDKGEKPFSLILMDIYMPVMDGLRAAALIKEMKIETPIVAVTTNVSTNHVEQYKENGIPDCVSKPVTEQKLRECIKKYIKMDEGAAKAVAESVALDEKAVFELADKLEPLLVDCNAECLDFLDEISEIPGTGNLAWFVGDFEFQKALDELNLLKKRVEKSG